MKPKIKRHTLGKIQPKPITKKQVHFQPVKVAKVKKTNKGLVISFTKA